MKLAIVLLFTLIALGTIEEASGACRNGRPAGKTGQIGTSCDPGSRGNGENHSGNHGSVGPGPFYGSYKRFVRMLKYDKNGKLRTKEEFYKELSKSLRSMKDIEKQMEPTLCQEKDEKRRVSIYMETQPQTTRIEQVDPNCVADWWRSGVGYCDTRKVAVTNEDRIKHINQICKARWSGEKAKKLKDKKNSKGLIMTMLCRKRPYLCRTQ